VNKADVAELVDARDLKCLAAIDFIGFRAQTHPVNTMEIDGTKRDLQNISTFVFALECPDNFGLAFDVSGVVLPHPV
jgi:hypothetical protein